MPNVITRKYRDFAKTGQEMRDLEQPLDRKTGYSNPRFDKAYPEVKNPFHGTERDLSKRKRYF